MSQGPCLSFSNYSAFSWETARHVAAKWNPCPRDPEIDTVIETISLMQTTEEKE